MITAYVVAFCRMVILIVFAWSFWGKVRDRQAFQEAIARFQLLPGSWHPFSAALFLAAELAVVGSMLAVFCMALVLVLSGMDLSN